MKITCRLLNLGVVDEMGEMFAKDCKFTFGNVIITDAGKQGIEHIEGTAVIEHKGDHLSAELDIRDDSPSGKLLTSIRDRQLPLKIYPAANGVVVAREGSVLTDVKINSIDLSVAGNADRTIPPLNLTVGEQDQD